MPKTSRVRAQTLAVVVACCCLLTGLLWPASHAQKSDARPQKKEATERVFRPTPDSTSSDITEAVNAKRAGNGAKQSATQPMAATSPRAVAAATTLSAQAGAASSTSSPASSRAPAQSGVAQSLVGSGQGAVSTVTVTSHETTGPVYQKVPTLTPEQEEAMAEELDEVNPMLTVPNGDGKKILDVPVDPPTRAILPGGGPTANLINTQQRSLKNNPRPEAASDLVYATVRDVPSGIAVQGASVGEPSIGSMGNTIFMTGNWYAARSNDGGATFTYVDPYNTFPSANRGFCCDQLANYAPAQDMMLWALQYRDDGTSNTLRLARAVGSTSVINNQWRYYDFTPQLFGFDPGAWLDFPDMAVASTFLYLSSNVYNTSGRFIGSVVWRVRLSDLAAGVSSLSTSYFKRTEEGSPRLTEGATTTMYWATHLSSSRMRIFHWDDGGIVAWDDVSVNPYTSLSRDGVATSPDGTNWAARADSRILGAWVAQGVIGFMWGAKQDSTFPYPYTIVARFNQNTRAIISQNNIWSPDYAWLIPTASVNAAGNLAGLLVYGGGSRYPSTNIWISDDVQNGFAPLTLYGATESNAGPTRNGWGDYHTVHPHKDFPNSWVAATYYLHNGSSDSDTIPRYLWFGRERDLGCSFSISPPSQSFGSSGGTGSVAVTASTSTCSRTATSNATWLTITAGASGTGSGTVNYSVAANTSSSPRTGTMTIAGRTFTVTQSGSTCTYSISPSSNSVVAGGATGSVAVTTGAGCGWSASSNVGWMSITSGSSGTGSGTVFYSVGNNTANISRTGTLTVAGQTFTVTQAAGGGGCTTTPIAIGQTINGTLITTDCKLSDGSSYDSYTFSASSGQQIIITMSSSAFDTYLFLLAPNGSVLTTNDDDGNGTNSRIPPGSDVFTLPSTGTYTILANSFAPSVTGSYTVSLRSGAQCSAVGISPGQTINGTLSTSDCTLSDGSFYDAYVFNGSSGQQVSVAMSSSGFDTYLLLLAPDGSVLTSDDDGGGGTNSRIPPGSGLFTLPAAGTYTIVANSFFSGATGSYTLNLASAQNTATVQLSAANFSVNESERKVLINVTRAGSASAPVSVDYATSDGTADRRKDYTQTLGTLDFAAGETTKTVTVFIADDAFLESPETFNFTLSNAVGATTGTPAASVVSINSNDATNGGSPVGDAAFSADFFVRQHYIDFFNREADAPGLAFWTNEITQCGANAACAETKRINVSAAFFLSTEFQNTGYLVYRFYKSSYGDSTSPTVAGTVPVIRLNEFLSDTPRIGRGVVVGFAGWEQQLEANKQSFALEFVQRTRFLTAFPVSMTPAAFVDKLNQNSNGALSQAERDQLVGELIAANNSNAGRASVLRKMAEDADLQRIEYNRAFVLMQYFGYLRRNPDDAPDANFGGWKFWLNKLDSFNGNYVNAEMIKAFITSGEYRQRFGS